MVILIFISSIGEGLSENLTTVSKVPNCYSYLFIYKLFTIFYCLKDNLESQDPQQVSSTTSNGGNKAKFSRGVTMYCIIATLLYVTNFSLENVDGVRPHGTTTLTMVCYGVLTPSIFFLINRKLLKFGLKLWNPFRLNCMKCQTKVHPNIWSSLMLLPMPSWEKYCWR